MTHDAHNRDNFYPHTEIEGGMDTHEIDPERDARLRAACEVGDALGLDNPRAEARIAADLGGVDGMGGAFAGAVGAIKARQAERTGFLPPDVRRCPVCGCDDLEYLPPEASERDTNWPGHNGGWQCAGCGEFSERGEVDCG